MMSLATAAMTIAVVGAAAYTDIRYRRIFNAITYSGVAAGLILNGIAGVSMLLSSLQGLAVAVGMLVFVALCGHILGGGDIKLLMAIGALEGPVVLLWVLLYAALAGGVLALLVALWHGALRHALHRVATSIYFRFALGEPMELEDSGRGPRLPYALAIGVGALIGMYVLRPW